MSETGVRDRYAMVSSIPILSYEFKMADKLGVIKEKTVKLGDLVSIFYTEDRYPMAAYDYKLEHIIRGKIIHIGRDDIRVNKHKSFAPIPHQIGYVVIDCSTENESKHIRIDMNCILDINDVDYEYPEENHTLVPEDPRLIVYAKLDRFENDPLTEYVASIDRPERDDEIERNDTEVSETEGKDTVL